MKKLHQVTSLLPLVASVAVFTSGALERSLRAAEAAVAETIVAVPGSIMTITLDRTVAPGAKSPQILIGKEVVAVQGIQGSNAHVLVPVLPPGAATVRVRDPGTEKETTLAQIIIAPAPSLRLLLSLTNGAISLIRATPSGGQSFAQAVANQARLSYDVFNKGGGLVISSSIRHPTMGRMEVFDEPQAGKSNVRAEPARREAIFSIKVPNIPGGGTVRFYDASPGIELKTEGGRSGRKFINAITF